jgi:hypothetical protein
LPQTIVVINIYQCYLNLKGVLQIRFWDLMMHDDSIFRKLAKQCKTYLFTAMWQDLQLLTVILQSESEVQHPGC